MKAGSNTEDWRTKAGIQVNAAAAVLDASPSTVWNLIREGELQTFKLGRSRRVRVDSILALLDSERKAA